MQRCVSGGSDRRKLTGEWEMLNQCNFIGRLGKDPETRSVGDTTVTNFSLACGEKWKDKQGNKQEKTEWVNCQAWGKLGEIVQQYVGKGDLLFVSGKLQTRKWQDQSGADKYTTEIVIKDMQMLGEKKQSGGGDYGQPPIPDDNLNTPF
jgi:single-strand DNA-binding protein